MRLFVAVNFTDEIKKRLLEIQERLRSQCLSGNFTRSENLHLTLAFLGETPEGKLPLLFQIMDGMKFSPFEVSFNHTGCFTHSRKELWWIGAGKNDACLQALRSIHGQLLSRLLEAGFSVDERPFNPHITLGREIKHSQPITLDCPGIAAKVSRISLMRSERIKGVLTYTELLP